MSKEEFWGVQNQISDWQGKQFFGYRVDTGKGYFIEEHALTFILSEHDYIYNVLEEKFEKCYEDTRS